MDTRAGIALARFGLGAGPGDRMNISSDPVGWLHQQIQPGAAQHALLERERTTEEGVAINLSVRQARMDQDERTMRQRDRRDAFVHDMTRRCLVRARTKQPFIERWVAFWSNHFTVSYTRSDVLSLAGPFERDAIRPYVLDTFEELLLRIARHPAMLVYLDNIRSIGPSSKAGQRRSQRGLNENFARELLELHTLGVRAGYNQDDVLALAKILTGWSVDPNTRAFRFYTERHEPGSKTLLGQRYAATGHDEGVRALSTLARHPATARHIATKLARHFVADDPPEAAIKTLEEVFLRTRGDLTELAHAVIDLPQAWAEQRTKIRDPDDLVVATARALGHTQDGEPLLAAMRWLGQIPHHAPSPKGWPDDSTAWLGPESLISRIEWAEQLASDSHTRVHASALADDLFGDAIPLELRAAIDTNDRQQSLALLLASPLFQRR